MVVELQRVVLGKKAIVLKKFVASVWLNNNKPQRHEDTEKKISLMKYSVLQSLLGY